MTWKIAFAALSGLVVAGASAYLGTWIYAKWQGNHQSIAFLKEARLFYGIFLTGLFFLTYSILSESISPDLGGFKVTAFAFSLLYIGVHCILRECKSFVENR